MADFIMLFTFGILLNFLIDRPAFRAKLVAFVIKGKNKITEYFQPKKEATTVIVAEKLKVEEN